MSDMDDVNDELCDRICKITSKRMSYDFDRNEFTLYKASSCYIPTKQADRTRQVHE